MYNSVNNKNKVKIYVSCKRLIKDFVMSDEVNHALCWGYLVHRGITFNFVYVQLDGALNVHRSWRQIVNFVPTIRKYKLSIKKVT